MYYEFNVAYEGKHFFATHERSVRDKWHAVQLAQVLRAKFPESEGYKVSCVKWELTGEKVDV